MTDSDLQAARELALATLPDPDPDECGEYCEHIECGYVVRIEQWAAERSRAMSRLVPALLDHIATLQGKVDAHLATSNALAAEVERLREMQLKLLDRSIAFEGESDRMRPVVEAAIAVVPEDLEDGPNWDEETWLRLGDAVDAYRAVPK